MRCKCSDCASLEECNTGTGPVRQNLPATPRDPTSRPTTSPGGQGFDHRTELIEWDSLGTRLGSAYGTHFLGHAHRDPLVGTYLLGPAFWDTLVGTHLLGPRFFGPTWVPLMGPAYRAPLVGTDLLRPAYWDPHGLRCGYAYHSHLINQRTLSARQTR